EFLAEAAIRWIIAGRELAARNVRGAVVGIGRGRSEAGRRGDERAADRRMDVRLNDEALYDDGKKREERGNPIERRPEKRSDPKRAQAPAPMRMSCTRVHRGVDRLLLNRSSVLGPRVA